MKNYTILFLLLFVASIAGGFAFKTVFDYSMIVGVGLGIVFLLGAAFFRIRGKRGKEAGTKVFHLKKNPNYEAKF